MPLGKATPTLRGKIILLLLGAAVWGAVIGLIAANARSTNAVLVAGLGLLLAALMLVARHMIWQPWEQMLRKLARAARPTRPVDIDALPTQRRDEIGFMARVVYQLSTSARRHERDATQLRRTLDQRINDATRQATNHLTQIAMRDPLTNLGNRRFLDRHLEPLVETCLNTRTDLQCLLIDLDNFKQVNDQLGHDAGDALLKFLGDLVRANVRRDDLAARIGGDEFVILMPGCRSPKAVELADTLRQWFDQHVASMVHSDPQPGLSMGLVCLRSDRIRSGADLLRRADMNLYSAKQQGRGRTIGA